MSACPRPLLSLLSLARNHRLSQSSRPTVSHSHSLPERLAEVFTHTWDLGVTAFGGPPVHFQILHQRFVKGGRTGKGKKWCDEDTVGFEILKITSFFFLFVWRLGTFIYFWDLAGLD